MAGKKFKYNHAFFRKGGNQTLFNVVLPLESDSYPYMTIKFFNEKISPEAIIQFIASFEYQRTQLTVFELELGEKKVIVRPANILYFAIYDYDQGTNLKEIPILIQENIQEKYPIKTYLERRELSTITKLLSRKGFSFDSYESNWKIEKIEQKGEVLNLHIGYVDIFQFREYNVLKFFLPKMLKNLKI